jgi:outer membrane protein OmpA-like peptidoglycan-associated protein
MSNLKLSKNGKIVLGILMLAAIFFGKKYWWDTRPQAVGESQTFGKVSLPDAPEASLTGNAAIKLEFPSSTPANNAGTKINWYIMAWQSQNSVVYANGGKETTKGSIYGQSGQNVSFIRQDDCAQSCAELVKFTKEYKDNPSTPGVFITFMGSGIPAYITGIANAVKDLGPEYQPVAFMTTGKSFGEDQVMGDIKYKNNPQLLKGATCVGYRMDGDNDIMLKFCGDNGIKVNSNEKIYDPEALNLMYCKDFLDAVVKFNSGYTETRKLVSKGQTTGRDTSISPDLVATWTPGDVNAYQGGRQVVTIISTKQYASMMPNITITCKKWLNDHRSDVEAIMKGAAIAGDQIRSFEDAKKFACKLNVEVYNEQTPEYWYKYYKGDHPDPNTQLGGSMVFNLADMANIFGVYIEGQTDHNDIYKAVYNTFGTLQSKYYPEDLPTYLDYSKAVDKSVLMTVISNNPELLQGKVNLVDYSKATKKIGNKSYQIQFQTGSAKIKESSYSVLDQIYQDLVAADGTKVNIDGYTDNTGSDNVNIPLSAERAAAVKDYLISKGIERARIESEGHGSENPIAPNDNEKGRSLNRRVEITLLSE